VRARLAGADPRWVAPLVTFLVMIVLYAPTVLPGVDFWDTAEYQTVGPVLGIAHPTGFPTYTLLTWLANLALAPIGEPAHRLNLFSAILMAGACGLTAHAVERLTGRRLLSVAGAVVLGTAPIAWWTANRAESHSLHLVFVALLLVLLIAWAERARQHRPDASRLLIAASAVYGLSLGNHGLTLLLAPGIAAFLLAVDRGLLRQGRLIAVCAGTIAGVAAAVYAYIPLRATMEPPLDYAHPDTLDRFLYLVLGTQFHGLFRNPLEGGPGPILQLYADQLGALPVALAIAGFAALALAIGRTGSLGPPVALLTGLWFLATTVFARGYADGFVDRFYLGPLLVAATWAACAVAAAWDLAGAWVHPRWVGLLTQSAGGPPSVAGAASAMSGERQVGPGQGGASARTGGPRMRLAGIALAAIVLIPLPAERALDGRVANDDSRERAGQLWADAALATLKPNAAVISWWSYSTTLWYERFVEGRRPDILIVDDRVRLDEGYGDLPATIDRFRAEGRPVYLIRPENEIPPLMDRYRIVTHPTVLGLSPVWEVMQ
jgi:hypothetical protein